MSTINLRRVLLNASQWRRVGPVGLFARIAVYNHQPEYTAGVLAGWRLVTPSKIYLQLEGIEIETDEGAEAFHPTTAEMRFDDRWVLDLGKGRTPVQMIEAAHEGDSSGLVIPLIPGGAKIWAVFFCPFRETVMPDLIFETLIHPMSPQGLEEFLELLDGDEDDE